MSLNKALILTVLSCTVNYGLVISPSYSQNLIKLPKDAKPDPTFTPRIKPTPSTFGRENPPPNLDRINSVGQFDIYRLDTGDGINISVLRFPEFSAAGNVDEEGNVVMPILGRVSLKGLSTSEAEAKIAYELGQKYLREQPEVLVALTGTRPAQISILGEVSRPGFYNFQSGSPLNVVLQTAGGTTQQADLRSIILRRTLVDGTIIEQEIDLYTPLLTGKEIPSPLLQGGDVIIVSDLQVGDDRDYDRSLVARSTLPQQVITVRVLLPSGTGTALRNLSLPSGSTFIDVVASLPPEDALLVDEDVALLRFDPQTKGIVTQELDTRKVIKGEISQNVLLQDEDVIVVSRTLLGKVFNAFTVITQPIATFLGFRRFFDFFLD
ncbi:MAG: polysaccharide biosynthesis/export family protein [Xenococcaceae cyanobacterium MO_188.B19]|nr:polysaccharide biosynthesis/export family protein [Xenococcaceae cyanobacterium MO_188.B19]